MYLLSNLDVYQFPASAGEPVYVLDLHTILSGLAAISSDQSLSLFDLSSLSKGPVRSFKTSHGNLTVARPFDHSQSAVCTAGSDGSVAIWDLRAAGVNPAQATRQIGSAHTSIASLACAPEANIVCAGTEYADDRASLVFWDVRRASEPVIQYKEVHSDDITELNFHPTDTNLLLSGSTDGLVNVYDLKITDEDEVVIQTFNHGASIHHSGFLNRSELFALSHDEKFALYDMAEEQEKGSATANFGDTRETLGCQYIANALPRSGADGPAGAVIGAGTLDQQKFELVHLSKGAAGWGFDSSSLVGLPGAHGSEVVRSFRVLDRERVVLTAGEDGQIKAWGAQGP
ncbi:hypothetical protein RB595_003192 [Gaeumannomyces hyphopodioides]